MPKKCAVGAVKSEINAKTKNYLNNYTKPLLDNFKNEKCTHLL